MNQQENKRPKVPDYLGKRFQLQLLLMVALLGVVLFFMRWAKNPDNWAWMWALSTQQKASLPDRSESVNTQLQWPEKQDSGPIVTVRPPVTESYSGENYFPGIKPGYFQNIEDDTPFRPGETDAWFHMLNVLSRSDPQELNQMSETVQFVQLFRQPQTYRGKLVRLQGTVRRVVHLQATENEYGVSDYYQVWLFPANNPVVVYCLDLPPEFPTEGDLRESVTVVGFFFKRWAYKALDDIRTAPLLAAHSLNWSPRPTEPPGRGRAVEPLLLIGGIILAWTILIGIRYRATRKKVQKALTVVPAQEDWVALHLADVAPGTKEGLRQLAEKEGTTQADDIPKSDDETP